MAKGKKNSKNKNLDLIYMGKEPILESISANDLNSLVSPLSKALGWYHYVHSHDQGKDWLVDWMKSNGYAKDQIKAIKAAKTWDIRSAAYWIAKIALNGTTLDDAMIHKMDGYIVDGVTKGKERIAEEEEDKPKANPHSRTSNKNNALMDSVEELVDTYFEYDMIKESMYDFLIKNEATASAASYIKERLTPTYDEMLNPDDQVKEAFGKRLKYWQTTYQDFMDDLDRYLNNKKAVKVRKPRTKKVKPIGKLVEKVQYQKEDTSLKIVSVNPAELVGAKSVWLYNTKYRTLSVLHAQNNNGLSVKGTTLINFDEATAISKKLRKPEEVIAQLFGAGKVALRKLMDDIKTAPSKPNGRINSNTIILKVLK